MINVGLIGYGLAGATFHAPLICANPQFHLSTVVTSRREPVIRELPGVAIAPTLSAVLMDPAIDLVVIASPSALHCEHAHAALLAGKNVVVDKPVATTSRQADELIELAARRSRVFSVFQNRRWDNDYLTVRRLVDQGSLGKVCHYEVHFDRFRPQVKIGWREEPGPGAGILYDLGTHLIDQSVHMFGMPRAVTADVIAQRAGAAVDDYFHLVLDYFPLRVILHAATLVVQPGPHFTVHGDGGSFLKYGMDGQEDALKRGLLPGDPQWGDDSPQNYGELTPAGGTPRKVATLRGGYEKYYEVLAACLETGGPPPVDPRDARDGLMVLEAAQRSAAERRTIGV